MTSHFDWGVGPSRGDHADAWSRRQTEQEGEMSVSRTFPMVMFEGRLVPTQPKQYADYLARIGDGEVRRVRISKATQQGTQSMRYYRGVVVPDIAEASGVIDPEDYEAVHDALAWKFLKLPNHPLFGTPRRRSTAKDDLTQEEMTAYIDKCITWAETSIPGCKVRRPDEVDEADIPDYDWKAA